MLKIRLTRTGKKNQAHYRIVVIPARTKRDGKSIEEIGYYNPREKKTDLNVERAKHWLSVGAQPTRTVQSILAKHKLMEKPPIYKSKKSQEKESKKNNHSKGKAKTKNEKKGNAKAKKKDKKSSKKEK